MYYYFREAITYAFGMALFINAMLFIPQIIRVYAQRCSKSVSMLTFVGFLAVNLLAVAYGVVRQDYLLIFGYSISTILNLILIVFIIIYRRY